jgi:hypothetical protein
MTTETYTRTQAMEALGIKGANAFHSLRRRYPQAFIVVHQGTGRGNETLYDKQAIDKFIQWRKLKKNYDHYTVLRDKYQKAE